MLTPTRWITSTQLLEIKITVGPIQVTAPAGQVVVHPARIGVSYLTKKTIVPLPAQEVVCPGPLLLSVRVSQLQYCRCYLIRLRQDHLDHAAAHFPILLNHTHLWPLLNDIIYVF